ncbi:hypothetical protein J1D01_16020 [Seonamhaeicola sp. NFXS20]|uniref:hypothetical protein n=1 Tax=Seonamhaeicola sp. NFXS20 TaxID=2816959 RepID=UPI003B8E1319
MNKSGPTMVYSNLDVMDINKNYKEEYVGILERTKTIFNNFKKENPNLNVTYYFDHVNKQFSIYDKEVHSQKEESICLNFLNLLNSDDFEE